MDKVTIAHLAEMHGWAPVTLMWKTLARWDDLRGETHPATGRNVALLHWENERVEKALRITHNGF
jgi:hypothetical protein